MRRCHLALMVALATLAGLAAGKAAEETGPLFKTVYNRRGVGYEEPRYLARPVFRVDFGHRVEVLETELPWQRVRPDGEHSPGWIHKSALDVPEIRLEPVDKKTRRRVKNGKTSLLGRAFRPQVADDYRRRVPRDEPGYAWLDRHAEDEVFRPSFGEIARFLEEGGLEPLAGGER